MLLIAYLHLRDLASSRRERAVRPFGMVTLYLPSCSGSTRRDLATGTLSTVERTTFESRTTEGELLRGAATIYQPIQ